VADEELPSLYAGAEVFVTMSSFEAYGMTVGEALAAETPCVVRECGGLGDWTAGNSCIGISLPKPPVVAKAVLRAQFRKVEINSLPTWDESVQEVESQYINNYLR